MADVKRKMLYAGGTVLSLAVSLAFFQAAEGATAVGLLEKFGLPVFYLFVVLLFVGRYLWPYVVSKDERNEAMQREFTATVRAMSAEQSAAMNKVVEAMTALKDEVREGRRGK